MSKLKVGILEDNERLLKDLKENLEETNLVEVVISATNSTDFLERIKTANIDALILDIDLGGDSMSGLDVANLLKLPVLFVSGKTENFIHGISELNINSDDITMNITKPITSEKLNKILPKFISSIKFSNKAKFVILDLGDQKNCKVAVDTIVYIETETGSSGASNNKKIYFTNREPETLFNFTLERIEEKGFDKSQFIKIKSSHRVNIDKILSYVKSSHEVEVEVFKSIGKKENKKLPVSENYQKDLRNFKK